MVGSSNIQFMCFVHNIDHSARRIFLLISNEALSINLSAPAPGNESIPLRERHHTAVYLDLVMHFGS
jgi:hypothetical protein